MRFMPAVVIGIGLLAGIPALATTLRLPEEMELLIVDGKPLGSTLLRGADSLELEQGRHQLVFIITKVLPDATGSPRKYTSPYIITQFTTQYARQLIFQLPTLATSADRDRFSHQPVIRLQDQRGVAVDATFSRLNTDGQALMDALHRYNLSLGLAQAIPPPTAGAGNGSAAGSTPITVPPAAGAGMGQNERMLRFWFLQADEPTREHFLQWARRQTH
ncbi:YccT family protein [Acerihabitans arboris]|uniref:DUF2057 domain-containing protein n=1 Tax=Acerihabitans arboris TaxID=2691583 RepID=A0A845SAY9_9GAMM|nr:DUF2057 family protein [Acerihabitans arboris]NDL61983.1 DUF2057 domain-containing protein [Acerihabitans arboris]